jgi:hypothetical protein
MTFSQPSLGQAPPPITTKTLAIREIAVEIAVDGKLDEPAWQTIEPVTDFTQSSPDLGKPASEQTEGRIFPDDNNLYVGFPAMTRNHGRSSAHGPARFHGKLRLGQHFHRPPSMIGAPAPPASLRTGPRDWSGKSLDQFAPSARLLEFEAVAKSIPVANYRRHHDRFNPGHNLQLHHFPDWQADRQHDGYARFADIKGAAGNQTGFLRVNIYVDLQPNPWRAASV